MPIAVIDYAYYEHALNLALSACPTLQVGRFQVRHETSKHQTFVAWTNGCHYYEVPVFLPETLRDLEGEITLLLALFDYWLYAAEASTPSAVPNL